MFSKSLTGMYCAARMDGYGVILVDMEFQETPPRYCMRRVAPGSIQHLAVSILDQGLGNTRPN